MGHEHDKVKAFLTACHDEGAKVGAAEKMVEAARSELEAAIIIGDYARIEQARYSCVARYEVFLDALIVGVKKLRNMGHPEL